MEYACTGYCLHGLSDRTEMNDHPFRDLPSVNELLNSEKLAPLFEHLSRQLVIQGVRETLDDIRNRYSHSGQIDLSLIHI